MKKKTPRGTTPYRYLLLVYRPSEDVAHEFVNRNDAVARIIELRQDNATVDAFVDAALEIRFDVRLEGIAARTISAPAPAAGQKDGA